MSGKPLTFESVAWAIAQSATGRQTAVGIARLLGCPLGPVRELLRHFLKDGVLAVVNAEGNSFYVITSADEEGEDENRAAAERERAEAMWKERMGDRRLTSLKLKPGPIAFYRSPPAFGDRTLAGVCCEWG